MARHGESSLERVKNMHEERGRSAFEQGGKRRGWCGGLVSKIRPTKGNI